MAPGRPASVLGHTLWPQVDVDRILEDVDVDGDGRICYEEFCNMLRAEPEPPEFYVGGGEA